MFGKNDDTKQQDNTGSVVTPDGSAPVMPGPAPSGDSPSDVPAPTVEPTVPPVPDIPQADSSQTPSAPPVNDLPSGVNGVSNDVGPPNLPQITSDYNKPSPGTEPPAAGNTDDLVDIKRQALQSLTPLVDELDQTPEEKFKTTMMLIQASDNPELIKDAFSAANSIGEEKARAQALLDVVNEINYFTQPHDNK